MRYDLTFLLCCCKSFLGSDDAEGKDFYSILDVDRDATQDEVKRAYKRASLQLHPDKLAQRGKAITEEDRTNFTRMKEAYEVLSDPHKRETYDAIGEKGMKWMDEPFSIDPNELTHNFATSSAIDRAKIFAIFVAIAVSVLILPVLICLHVDGTFGDDASWLCTLIPLWMWNAFILFYHSRVILMGPIHRPDHIPEQDWVDPLPMAKRITSLVRFVLIMVFEFLVAFKLDDIVSLSWAAVFLPFFAWETTTLIKRWPIANLRVVTVADLEIALGKAFQEFTPAEKELIAKRYSVVPSITSPEFEAAQILKSRARHDMVVSAFRMCFALLLIAQVESWVDWNWWLVFSPFWVLSILLCCTNLQSYLDVQQMAVAKDPTLFSDTMPPPSSGATTATSTTGGATAAATTADAATAVTTANPPGEGSTNYGSVGTDGDATAAEAAKATTPQTSTLTEEERDELKAEVIDSGSKLCNKCCSQGFTLILMLLFVSKLQGAGFSSLWIISPFLFGASISLCCLGIAIFSIRDGSMYDGVEFDTGHNNTANNTQSNNSNNNEPAMVLAGGVNYSPPIEPGNASSPNTADIESGLGNTATGPATPTAPVDGTASTPVDLLDSDYPESSNKNNNSNHDGNAAAIIQPAPSQEKSDFDDLD